jgi:hypothetical protein
MLDRATLLVLSAGLALACASPDAAAPPPRAPEVPPPSFDYLFPRPGEDGRAACPMGLGGVHVTSIPTDSGSLLAFTSEENLSALRRRARALTAELDGKRVDGIATAARYSEIPNGATVEVMAATRERALALRDALERIVREMQAEEECPEGLIAAR